MWSFFSRFSSLRPLRHSEFAWLWCGAFVSNVGTWMENVALGLYVAQHSDRAGWPGTVAALLFLPSFFLSPLAGVVGDRVNRRLVLALGASAHALLGLSLCVLFSSGHLTLPAIGAVALLSGCVSAFYGPTMNATVGQLVERDELHSALSLNSAQFNLGRVMGPLAGVLLASHFSLAAAFAAKAVGFSAVLLALLRQQSRPPAVTEDAPIWHDAKEGFLAARQDPGVWLALKTTLAVSVAVAPFIGLIPVMAVQLLGGGAREAATLVSCQGLGAVAAALAAGPLSKRIRRTRLLELALLCAGASTALYWLSPNLRWASVSIFVLGGAYMLSASGLLVVCQSRMPAQFQARISSIHSAVLNGCYALGVAAHGVLGDTLGVREVGALMGFGFAAAVQWGRTRPERPLAALDTLRSR